MVHVKQSGLKKILMDWVGVIFNQNIFVDLTLAQDSTCDRLSKQSLEQNYNDMYHYFKAHYKLVKLSEFVKTQGNSNPTLEQLVDYAKNSYADGFFNYKLADIINDEELKDDPDIQAILKLDIPALNKYVEILCNDKANWKLRIRKS